MGDTIDYDLFLIFFSEFPSLPDFSVLKNWLGDEVKSVGYDVLRLEAKHLLLGVIDFIESYRRRVGGEPATGKFLKCLSVYLDVNVDCCLTLLLNSVVKSSIFYCNLSSNSRFIVILILLFSFIN